MTGTEILSDMSAHMIKGLMLHSQLADYYMFLGLEGYAKCHKKHYKKESKGWRKLSAYYIRHYNKLITEKPIENPQAIPKTWYQFIRQNVDRTTKMKAVKSGLQMWRDWETETKELYQRYYKELIENDEVASAIFIKQYICDVDDEIIQIQNYILNKESIDYDMTVIIQEQ